MDVKSLFEQEMFKNLALKELQNIKGLVEERVIPNIPSDIKSFGKFVESNYQDFNQVLTNYELSKPGEKSNSLIMCVTDVMLDIHKSLREDAINFANGLTDNNPFEEIEIEQDVAQATDKDIKNAITALIDINGFGTTLEVKNRLWDLGFGKETANQNNVSKVLNKLYEEDYLVFTTVSKQIDGRTVTFRNYAGGDKFGIFDLSADPTLTVEEDSTEEKVNEEKESKTANYDVDSSDITDLKDLFNSVVASKGNADRNAKIIRAKSLGYKTKQIAEVFGLSVRGIQYIINPETKS